MEPPQGFDPDRRGERPDRGEPPEGFDPAELPQPPEGDFGGRFPGFGGEQADGSGSTEFMLTESAKSFSGVCDSDASGKTRDPFSVGALPFLDLEENEEGYTAVKALYSSGVLKGTSENTFSPRMTVTRAQAVTALGRLVGAEEAESAAFGDVDGSAWYAGYVGWAVETGIVEGDGQGHFLPDETVTAEHMALMLERYDKNYVNQRPLSGPLTRLELALMLNDAGG